MKSIEFGFRSTKFRFNVFELNLRISIQFKLHAMSFIFPLIDHHFVVCNNAKPKYVKSYV